MLIDLYLQVTFAMFFRDSALINPGSGLAVASNQVNVTTAALICFCKQLILLYVGPYTSNILLIYRRFNGSMISIHSAFKSFFI